MFHTEDVKKWNKEVILKIIENLKENVDEARYEISKQTGNVMSIIYNICVKFKNRTKDQSEEFSIILKKPTQFEFLRQTIRSDVQFHNEILFYRMYAQPNENFAKCFYIDERPPFDSVIALENVNEQGYYSCACPCKTNTPLEYTLAAMREIGRFHGKGYVMKELQREKFFAIVEQLQEIKYDKMLDENRIIFLNLTATRAVEYLRNQGYDTAFCDRMEALLSNAFDKVMMKTVESREPLSTLCHGDFVLDNILFKTENGQHRAILIDFACLRYSTPVVDLSTYLYLSCSNEVRKDKFFEIIRAYHDALKEYLLEANIWDSEKYSYDALLDDYKIGGLFGFVIASFYLPILMGYVIKGHLTCINEFENEETAKQNKQLGGDKISKILADMLLHLRDLGCVE
ncbi:hypothetical protein ALC56_08420 [Trachymyrmex septentrionalis]|uniref:CHK kinase-like domain-containing protein n=1 Tax=Trachymyrmex septentrionalis TaxID=34720 RepID=A0A195F7N5_9HYME|nr:PREDICTED: uncharacterized protein LOC108750654 [Trachymyrmex septentrionalis]KYN36630.1 hypothetical protein ALC56_08420 [Trachymyrmex septentrionalis]